MGAHKSKNPLVLSEKEIRFIQHKTGMSRDDVLYFHRDFIANHPEGYITREDFIDVYKQLYSNGQPEEVYKLAFDLFGRKTNGRITFAEFLVSSALANGKNHRKASHREQEDKDNSLESSCYSRLDRETVEEVLLSIYEPDGHDQEYCRKKADAMMGDHNHISREAFIRFVLDDDEIRKRYLIESQSLSV